MARTIQYFPRNNNKGSGIMNPFTGMRCKTKEDKLRILSKAHLDLPIIDNDYMPDELYEKRRELEQLMLKYIWKWRKEIGVKA